MFCNKCGKELLENSKFCPNCGEKVSNEQNKVSKAINIDDVKSKLSVLSKKRIIGIAVVAILVIVITLFVSKRANTIDMNKYVDVNIDGYDGYGYADVSIDWDGLIKDHGDKIYDKSDLPSNSNMLISLEPEDYMMEYISVEINKSNRLSNGDKVEYSWKVNPKLNRIIDLDFKCKDGSVVVDSLKEVETYDVFEHVSVDYIGVSPFVSIAIKYDGDYFDNSDFSSDKIEGLSEGETITVTFDADIDIIANNLGVVPAETSKAFVVECNEKYAQKVSEINDAAKEKLKKQADDVVKSYAADWDDYVSLTSSEYIGDYIISAKDNTENYQNEYVLVYKLKAKISDGQGVTEVDNYYSVGYPNLTVDKEGNTNISLLNYWISSDNFAVHQSWVYWFVGYETLTDLKANLVDSKADFYNCDWNVSE